MEIELDQIWMRTASWGLVHFENPTGVPDGDGAPGRMESQAVSSLRGITRQSINLYDPFHGNEKNAA